jgi:hypothetical protein
MGVDYVGVVKEIGATSLGESDVRFDEAVFEFINSTRQEMEEAGSDAISGEAFEGGFIKEARKVEMETFSKHGACEKAPVGVLEEHG